METPTVRTADDTGPGDAPARRPASDAGLDEIDATDELEATAATGEPVDVDDVDADFAPRERRGLGRLTVGLLAAIALVLAFGAGAWAQQKKGGSDQSGPAAFAGRAPGGGAEGGFSFPGGAAGAPGGTTGSGDSGGTGTTGTGGTGTSGSGTSTTP